MFFRKPIFTASRRMFSSCKHDNSDIHKQLNRIEDRQKDSFILQFVIYVASLSTCVMVFNKK